MKFIAYNDSQWRQRVSRMSLALTISLIAGAFAVFLLGTIRVDPTSTLWLNEGDIAQHYLGWNFFRGESWMLPLGANPRYGMDMGSSVVFTDSIPLLAIIFKSLSPILPLHFQYAGSWMVFCFAMQGVSALLLLRRFSDNTLVLLSGATFFVMSPILVSRTMGHFALTAQWTILLALCLYFTPGSSHRYTWYWRALIVVTSLIHGYLLYFVLAIWASTLLRDQFLADRQPKSYAALNTSMTLLFLLGALWLGGWFEIPVDAAAFGNHYGLYAANLMALVNPVWGSPFLVTHHQAATASGIESINYLGLGVILACIIVTARASRNFPLRATLLRHRFLLLICLGFSILAFSHNIYWGDTLIAHLPLPEALRLKLEFVRASGRLLWLVHYLIILASIVLVVRSFPWAAPMVMLAMLVVQVFDFVPSYRSYANVLKQSAESAARTATESKSSPFWVAAASRYVEVDFYPITHSPPRYEQVALWAGDNHIAINSAYFGRISADRAFANTPNLERELTTGGRRSTTLYILQNKSDLQRLVLQPQDGVGEIDGYLIVAPDWFKGVKNVDAMDTLRPFRAN